MTAPRVSPARLAASSTETAVTPPEDVIDDMFLLSEGSISRLIQMARLAVTDWQDLEAAADEVRNRS